jgi:hypothetical protein
MMTVFRKIQVLGQDDAPEWTLGQGKGAASTPKVDRGIVIDPSHRGVSSAGWGRAKAPSPSHFPELTL